MFAMSKSNAIGFLELKVPPPVVFLFMAGLGWLVSRSAPTLGFVLPHRNAIVLALFVAGVCVALLGVASFRSARTTLNPLKPEKSSALVISGIYRYTRNPMYLGLLLVLLGWSSFLANDLAFVFVPVFILYMNRFQIHPEERVLVSIFGQEFTAYRSKVRRWL
jgi:protein-S-isoprenylcysteine O-methyltransferase Ste14